MKKILSFSLILALGASLVPVSTIQAGKHDSTKINAAKLILGSGCLGISVLSGWACVMSKKGTEAALSGVQDASNESSAGIALVAALFCGASSLATGAVALVTAGAGALLLNDSIPVLKYRYDHRNDNNK